MTEQNGSPAVHLKFERIEKKFRMRKEQYEALLPTLEAHLERDAYGETTVCNIYYDTPDYLLIRRSVERPPFKEKLRLRSYKRKKSTVGRPCFCRQNRNCERSSKTSSLLLSGAADRIFLMR